MHDRERAFNVTRGYAVSRYLNAIQSRGTFPIHHNGGTVTWGSPRAHENPDYRFWGGALDAEHAAYVLADALLGRY